MKAILIKEPKSKNLTIFGVYTIVSEQHNSYVLRNEDGGIERVEADTIVVYENPEQHRKLINILNFINN